MDQIYYILTSLSKGLTHITIRNREKFILKKIIGKTEEEQAKWQMQQVRLTASNYLHAL